jgi:hypothetical protein
MNKVLSEQQLYDFIKLVCEDLSDLTGQAPDENHFFGSVEEAQSAKANRKLFFPAIILGTISGKLTQNTIDVKTFRVFIVKQAPREDYFLQRSIRDECLTLGMAITERLNQYRHAGNGFGNFIQHFHTWETAYHEIVIPIMDNAIGYAFNFSLGSQREIKTDL